jgi:uncharacterized protein (DUF433 family)
MMLAGSRGTPMTMVTEHPHIVRDDRIPGGEPIIKGTRTPVRLIVEMWWMGMPPEEMLAGLPHLTLAQVFDADHQLLYI